MAGLITPRNGQYRAGARLLAGRRTAPKSGAPRATRPTVDPTAGGLRAVRTSAWRGEAGTTVEGRQRQWTAGRTSTATRPSLAARGARSAEAATTASPVTAAVSQAFGGALLTPFHDRWDGPNYGTGSNVSPTFGLLFFGAIVATVAIVGTKFHLDSTRAIQQARQEAEAANTAEAFNQAADVAEGRGSVLDAAELRLRAAKIARQQGNQDLAATAITKATDQLDAYAPPFWSRSRHLQLSAQATAFVAVGQTPAAAPDAKTRAS